MKEYWEIVLEKEQECNRREREKKKYMEMLLPIAIKRIQEIVRSVDTPDFMRWDETISDARDFLAICESAGLLER